MALALPPHTGILREENIALRQILGYRLDTLETSPYSPPQIGQYLPGTFIKDVLLVSIDVDTKDYKDISPNHDFRIGVSILDTRCLVQKPHDPRDAITSHQFINRDSKACNSAAKRFLFGKTETMKLPKFALWISELTKDRDYVLLAHGTNTEVKFLNDIDPEIRDRASYILDTVKAEQNPLQLSYRYSLGKLLDEFGIRHARLHTAGNDAHFALKALLMIAVCDGQKVPETAAPGDEEPFRCLDAIAHAPCNLPVWTEAPSVTFAPPKPKPVVKAKSRRRKERDASRQAFQELPFADEPPTDPSTDKWQRQIQAYYKTLF